MKSWMRCHVAKNRELAASHSCKAGEPVPTFRIQLLPMQMVRTAVRMTKPSHLISFGLFRVMSTIGGALRNSAALHQ